MYSSFTPQLKEMLLNRNEHWQGWIYTDRIYVIAKSTEARNNLNFYKKKSIFHYRWHSSMPQLQGLIINFQSFSGDNRTCSVWRFDCQRNARRNIRISPPYSIPRNRVEEHCYTLSITQEADTSYREHGDNLTY